MVFQVWSDLVIQDLKNEWQIVLLLWQFFNSRIRVKPLQKLSCDLIYRLVAVLEFSDGRSDFGSLLENVKVGACCYLSWLELVELVVIRAKLHAGLRLQWIQIRGVSARWIVLKYDWFFDSVFHLLTKLFYPLEDLCILFFEWFVSSLDFFVNWWKHSFYFTLLLDECHLCVLSEVFNRFSDWINLVAKFSLQLADGIPLDSVFDCILNTLLSLYLLEFQLPLNFFFELCQLSIPIHYLLFVNVFGLGLTYLLDSIVSQTFSLFPQCADFTCQFLDHLLRIVVENLAEHHIAALA